MDGEAVREIERMAQDARIVKDKNGQEYSVHDLNPVIFDPRPRVLQIQSLTGILDYLSANVDGCEKEKLMIHIVDHEKVNLVTHVHGDSKERHTVLTAKREGKDFSFEHFIDQELFIIRVRSLFEETNDRADILHHTAKIDTTSAIKTDDDGIKQNIQVKKGLSGALTEAQEIKPIVKLKPCRTFSEVDQPESEFLFRMRDSGHGVECALFESDNAAWKNEARMNIKKFLESSGVVILA